MRQLNSTVYHSEERIVRFDYQPTKYDNGTS